MALDEADAGSKVTGRHLGPGETANDLHALHRAVRLFHERMGLPELLQRATVPAQLICRLAADHMGVGQGRRVGRLRQRFFHLGFEARNAVRILDRR